MLLSLAAAILSILPGVESSLGMSREVVTLVVFALVAVFLVVQLAQSGVRRPVVAVTKATAPETALEPELAAAPTIAATAVPTKKPSVHVVFATTSGTSKLVAQFLSNLVTIRFGQVELDDLKEYDGDQLDKEDVVLFVVSTWSQGSAPLSCKGFFDFVAEAAVDFRYGATHLSKVKYAVFGIGSALYDDHFCAAAKKLDQALHALGGQRLAPVGLGDDQLDLSEQLETWANEHVWVNMTRPLDAANAGSADAPQESQEACSDDGDDDGASTGLAQAEADEDELNDELVNAEEPLLADVEDLSLVPSKAPAGEREMVTAMQRKNLTKQGYKLIGSHSAVKICRWTKAQLRGRGGCYKHTLYGIQSYQCMEATPSLACANKCVFCWRTHTNPVGREWRWKTDPPAFIVEQAVSEHVKMMKALKGMPGVVAERFKEAMTVRHCALSLVGEPIMYPHINQLVEQLHDRNISTFLVTNAQFPEAIRSLRPVTQLYCSIDASTKDALKAIDRPLFSDFWERFNASLAALKEVCGRTVFRLTLVKDRNVGTQEDLDGYARLVLRTMPDLVEIKGVTFCGKSEASDLRMSDVPWHHEVRAFAEQLCARVHELSDEEGFEGYGMASEHAHSCCVLMARKDRFLVKGKWHTWIDFDGFQRLERRWRATGQRFTAQDYRLETPAWAVYGAKEEGFDPVETRFRKGVASAPGVSTAALPGVLLQALEGVV